MKLKPQNKRRYLVYALVKTGWDEEETEWWTATWSSGDGGYFLLDLPMVGVGRIYRDSQVLAIRNLPVRPFIL